MTDPDTSITQENQNSYGWIILGILTVAQLVMSMGAYTWGPLAPVLRDEFNLSRAQIGTITSVLYFASVIIAIPSGIAVDKLGARIMLIISLIIMGIPFAIMALAKNYLFFIVFAAVGGLGYGMINQISTKGIMYWFSARFRATAMGIKQTGVTLGGAIVAVLLPALTVAYSWRLGVLVIGILMLVMAFLSLIFYKERPVLPAEGASNVASTSKKGQKEGSLLKVMSNPVLLILCLITPLMAFGQTGIASFLVLYLEEELNFSVGLAGGCLTAAMIAGSVGRIGWGIISDRLFAGDRMIPIVILSVIAFIGALGTAFLSKGSPLWLSFFWSILMGGTFIGWNAVLITLAAELAGKELAGSIMGILVTIAWIGIIIGPPVFGYIADSVGYYWSWLLIAVLALLSTVGFLYILRLSKRGNQEVYVG
ncbi:MAG: MFS transporter [Deltaproteobacteria bacterium]|jgi:sugar phosphate permease|nr:MAG: MFS transporter [Deltaproteobacteria bacterium]